MTKKKVFWISLAGTALAFLLESLYKGDVLSRSVYKTVAEPLFILCVPLVIFSIVTYKMREEVFRTWLHFAYWWIPLSFVLIYLAGGSGGGGFGIPNIFDQEFVALIFSFLFAIISLILILWKYFSSRHSGQV